MKSIRRVMQWNLLIALFLLISQPVFGQVKEGAAPLQNDPSVRYGVLSNGLTYYIRKNKEPENRAELRLAVNAGSVLEDDAQQGLAHFVEHMAFNGTKNFKKNELVNYLESIGTKFGAHLNAYTSFDETVYMLQVPTDTPEIMDKAFLVLEDWAHNVSFENEEIDKERGVIIEEWRLGRGAEARMRDKYLPVLFYKSQYAERLPIGKKEILETFDYETLKRFYKTWYRPDLMAIIAVGDFDLDAIEKRIKAQFESIPKPASDPGRKAYDLPDHDEILVSVEKDKEANFSLVQVNYKHPGKTIETEADYREKIVGDMVTGMLNNRIQELIQSGKAPLMFGATNYGTMLRSRMAFSAFGVVNPAELEKGVEILMTELERGRRHGFVESELERQKKSRLSELESAFNEKDKSESEGYTWEYVQNFLNKEPFPGIESELEMHKKYLSTITVDEVNRKIKEWITDKNTVVLINGQDVEGVQFPTRERVLALVSEVKGRDIAAYDDKTDDRPLIEKDLKPGEVTKTSEIKEFGITEWTLSNGARVILKPTDFKDDEILFQGFSRGGYSRAPDKQIMSAENAAQIVGMSGVGKFDDATLQKKLSDKVVEISPWISEWEEGIRGTSSKNDLETMFQLAYLYFTAPRQDGDAFKAFKTQMKGYAAMSASPDGKFREEVSMAMSGYHFRNRALSEETIAEINQGDAMMFYIDRFSDASDFTFTLIGNFTLEGIKPLVTRYIGSLPNYSRKESWKDNGIRTPSGVVEKTIKKGIEPKSMVNLTFHGPIEWNSQNRITTQALVKVLGIMLRESMREDKGGVYGVGVNASTSPWPMPGYKVTISFGCAPENVEDLIATAIKDINALKNEGASATNLTKMKETFRRERETDLKKNEWWQGILKFFYAYNENPMVIQEYNNIIAGFTSEDIQKAARLYLNEGNLLKVILMPENK